MPMVVGEKNIKLIRKERNQTEIIRARFERGNRNISFFFDQKKTDRGKEHEDKKYINKR